MSARARSWMVNNINIIFTILIDSNDTWSIHEVILGRIIMKTNEAWAVVLAPLVERSLPTPEIRGSISVIGKKIIMNVFCQLFWKDQNKEKRAGNGNETVIFFSNLGNCADLVWIFSKGACFKCLIYKNKGQTLCYP